MCQCLKSPLRLGIGTLLAPFCPLHPTGVGPGSSFGKSSVILFPVFRMQLRKRFDNGLSFQDL